MSRLSIQKYYRKVEETINQAQTHKESALRRHFANLVESYCEQHKLTFADESHIINKNNQRKYPDGAILLKGVAIGYWESKDRNDDLEVEIQKKFAIGYPQFNILFEDSQRIILYQAPNRTMYGSRVAECDMRDENALHEILLRFVQYEIEEVRNFRTALHNFTAAVPRLSEILNAVIAISAGEKKIKDFPSDLQMRLQDVELNEDFIQQRADFCESCRTSINPSIRLQDIDEMIIQHILTEDIFTNIFGSTRFHRENNIARQLAALVETFFVAAVYQNTVQQLAEIYAPIIQEARNLHSHQEKQRFLKLIYEEFYKAYNPKNADRLGIVYTPSEVVQFIIKSTDTFVNRHFGKTLSDHHVHILDPATGTGTFVTELLEYLQLGTLEHKYLHEIHANEISILPYYIANLNIELAFQERQKRYKSYPNICFVDTLEQLGGMPQGHLGDSASSVYATTSNLFAVSAENARRIQAQDILPISVIIGNPPYNAQQKNENDENKNREYPPLDQRIKTTYIAESTAQKTYQYDMYKRFIRWASDRLGENGIISFVVNRSFIDKRQDDGFRKSVSKEFDYVYIVDLGGDVRANGADASDNVFGIMTGVAILFFVRQKPDANSRKHPARIQYYALPNYANKAEKLHALASWEAKNIPFQPIYPDEKGNWINQTNNDFSTLLPLCAKSTKFGKNGETVFNFYTVGISTNRDEWVYDADAQNLANKMRYFSDTYNQHLKEKNTDWGTAIKWSETLKRYFARGVKLKFSKKNIRQILYRPFAKRFFYAEKIASDRLTQNHFDIWGNDLSHANPTISFTAPSGSKTFHTLISNQVVDLHFAGDTQCLSLYRYAPNGVRTLNISQGVLEKFALHYGKEISGEDIFKYVYAVLHAPAYRAKYATNLQQEFPRLPFYRDFDKWVAYGAELMDLHLNYEQAALYPLTLQQVDKPKPAPKVKLKADHATGCLWLDDNSYLEGVPSLAWGYMLGNRSALEWVLDQWKEKKPEHPIIAAEFNTYRFANYRAQVIELLQRVCTVAVRTMEILAEMPKE